MTRDPGICVARIGAAHGVRGEVRLWPFTEDPMAVIDYGPLSTKDGVRQFEVVRARIAKDHLVAVLKGITTREDARRNSARRAVAAERFPGPSRAGKTNTAGPRRISGDRQEEIAETVFTKFKHTNGE